MAAVRALLLAVLALLTSAAPPARAAESLQLVEQGIKAGLLYNFLKYTDWPQGASATAPIVVCLMGGDPFGGRLQPMAGRSVNQRIIEIRDIADAAAAAPCSLVFVNASMKSQWDAVRRGLAGKAVLTVSDFAGFSDAGGMIEFTRVDNRIGVKINAGAVSQARLVVQDRLMKLASTRSGK